MAKTQKSNTILSLTSWTDTSKRMTTSTLPLDLQFDKTLLDSSDEDSSDEEDYVPYAHTKTLHEWCHSKYRINFLVGRQLKQFVDIITMNVLLTPHQI